MFNCCRQTTLLSIVSKKRISIWALLTTRNSPVLILLSPAPVCSSVEAVTEFRASKPKPPRSGHLHCLLKLPDLLLHWCTTTRSLLDRVLHHVPSKSSPHQPWSHSKRSTCHLVFRPDLRHKLDDIHFLHCCSWLLFGGFLTPRRRIDHWEAGVCVWQVRGGQLTRSRAPPKGIMRFLGRVGVKIDLDFHGA